MLGEASMVFLMVFVVIFTISIANTRNKVDRMEGREGCGCPSVQRGSQEK